MRNKFLGTGEQGYHPVRKVQNVISGLRYAVLTDFSVAYKLYLSLIILIATFALRQKVRFAFDTHRDRPCTYHRNRK